MKVNASTKGGVYIQGKFMTHKNKLKNKAVSGSLHGMRPGRKLFDPVQNPSKRPDYVPSFERGCHSRLNFNSFGYRYTGTIDGFCLAHQVSPHAIKSRKEMLLTCELFELRDAFLDMDMRFRLHCIARRTHTFPCVQSD
jgi:hypothetical protein